MQSVGRDYKVSFSGLDYFQWMCLRNKAAELKNNNINKVSMNRFFLVIIMNMHSNNARKRSQEVCILSQESFGN